MKTILVVEDDPGIQELLRFNLSKVNYRVLEAANVTQAWGFLKCTIPDLMLVDWNMPVQTGIDLVRSMRSQSDYRDMPVIMVTARYSEQDKLEAFAAGVDDVVCKPFQVRELLARIQAKLIRAQYDRRIRVAELDGLYVCLDHAVARLGEQTLKMGETEMRLLYYLMSQAGKVLSRADIARLVWGAEVDVQERTVDAYVARLRRVLKEAGCRHEVGTIWSIGYRLQAGSDVLPNPLSASRSAS